jgi:acetyltransferase-like isoleucine patch superfamily enzyme
MRHKMAPEKGMDAQANAFLDTLKRIQKLLQGEKMARFKRRVGFGELVTDRWENAREYGFGEGASLYDSTLVIGDVRVGRGTWIGPFVVLDGSAPGGLQIGEFCSISAGVQIYSHNSVAWSLSGGKAAIERSTTRIGDHCFIGPNVVISNGVTIGDRVAIGAMSFVDRDVPSDTKAFGIPAKYKLNALPSP